MVLLTDGTILSWGENNDGQLGIPRCYLSMQEGNYEQPQNINFLNSDAIDSKGNPLSFGR